MTQDNGRRLNASMRASDLAQMRNCERLVVLASMCGSWRSPSQEEARRQGFAAHERFKLEGRRAIAAGGSLAKRPGERCVIATMIFGDAWQTEALRDFRYTALRPSPWGRRLVAAYYAGGPRICSVLQRCPPLLLMTGCILCFAALGRCRWTARRRP